MYMYYLLGFRIVRMCQEAVTSALNEGRLNELLSWGDRVVSGTGNIGKSHIFQAFDEQIIRKVSTNIQHHERCAVYSTCFSLFSKCLYPPKDTFRT